MKGNSKNASGCIRYHGKILFQGAVRMVHGTAIAGLMALAIYGFVMIPSEGGYIAVCDFIGSIATIAVALNCMYSLGSNKKKGAKK